jgi:hypothetical protein
MNFEDSPYYLFKKIHTTFTSPELVSIQEFQSCLNKFRSQLLNPLKFKVLFYFKNKTPRQEDKQKIESKKFTKNGVEVEIDEKYKQLV